MVLCRDTYGFSSEQLESESLIPRKRERPVMASIYCVPVAQSLNATFSLDFHFMYRNICMLVFMSMYHVCLVTKEVLGSPGAAVTACCEPDVGAGN